jgi:hypothetical protein
LISPFIFICSREPSDVGVDLRTALDIRNQILAAPKEFDEIGESDMLKNETIYRYLQDADFDEEMVEFNDHLWNTRKLVRSFATGALNHYHHDFYGAFSFKEERFRLSLNSEEFDKLYAQGQISGFGDVTTQENRIDATVRRSREITDFSLTDEDGDCRAIEQMWSKHFLPANVRAEPYKISLYKDGDFFSPHKDTPSTNLVGTFLIALHEPELKKSGGLKLQDEDGNWCEWQEGRARNPWCAFYADVPHEVAPVVGCRATLAFRIYAKEDQPAVRNTTLPKLECPASLSSFGLLLNHQYFFSTSPASLKGSDKLIYDQITSDNRFCCKLIRVVITGAGTIYNNVQDATEYCEYRVYPLTKQDHQQVADLVDVPVQFFAPGGTQTWSESEVSKSGNDVTPLEIDSYYVDLALIVTKK